MLAWVEELLYAIVLLVVVTQIFIPLLCGKQFFPIFRGKRRKLESELISTLEDRDIAKLEKMIVENKERNQEITPIERK